MQSNRPNRGHFHTWVRHPDGRMQYKLARGHWSKQGARQWAKRNRPPIRFGLRLASGRIALPSSIRAPSEAERAIAKGTRRSQPAFAAQLKKVYPGKTPFSGTINLRDVRSAHAKLSESSAQRAPTWRAGRPA